jgi:hypothetical protein
MNRHRRKFRVTAELVESIALNLRDTKIAPALAHALAPNLERVNNAALAAAKETDFNDEPTRFTSVLEQLQAPLPRR